MSESMIQIIKQLKELQKNIINNFLKVHAYWGNFWQIAKILTNFVDSWDVSDDLGVAPALGVFQRCPAFIVDHPEGGTPLHQ